MPDLKKEPALEKIPIDSRILQVMPRALRDDSVDLLGNVELLKSFKIGLICSIKCPGDVILKALNLLTQLDGTEICFIGGFHSPVERECLDILLRSKQKLIVCPARNIRKMRLSRAIKTAVEEGRLALLSPFPERYQEASGRTAQIRNLMVAALADRVLVFHAARGGKTEELVKEVVGWGKTVYTIASEYNTHLAQLGVKMISSFKDLEMRNGIQH